MSADLGSEFPLVKAALSMSATTPQPQQGDDRDVSGLRTAVGEPGLPYWTFDNVNAIPAESAPPAPGMPLPDITGPLGAEPPPAAVPPLPPHEAAPDPAWFPMAGSPPPVSPSPPPSAPVSPPSAAPAQDDFAAFRARPTAADRGAPAEDSRRMTLSDMFAVLRGPAPASRKDHTLRDMFR
ncbi:hypothetical protein [Gluconacetobacter takamatsuzukensis]|uniref:Uncharacterized protein n=1 Tax=Gluconacetobacter takamatsuzukensis TaxID=1286190 RepID=A0A7W4KEN3_9PROT|nr:hypothetical protein [Gluconacetobacter takamatsuzukensis]MBB2205536.1 hypothetical protein [Gluconacetobacter takamatsuzukensis]